MIDRMNKRNGGMNGMNEMRTTMKTRDRKEKVREPAERR